jgi:hypothetical protein
VDDWSELALNNGGNTQRNETMADTKTDTTAEKRMADEKKKLAAEREAREKAAEERAKTRGRPTPTQEECDLAARGLHPELSPDGSPGERPAGHETRHIEAGSGGTAGYQTRQSTAQPHANKAPEKSSA